MPELCFLSATDAISAFRQRTLSPVELMEAVIARAEATEPTIGALVHPVYDEALAQAREAERRYAASGAPPRPLEGVPIVVKEDEPIAGTPWTQGSLAYRDAIAPHTAELARRVVDSGAIVHARSAASEFACAVFTHSLLWGVTRNPWNPEYSPGGSSGGSGAALASGATVLATGSDTAGSIRIPASFTGVVGYKPPRGRVPVDAPYHLDRYVHSAPMARTVRDCALLENVLSGPFSGDLNALPPPTLPTPSPDVRGLRVAISADLGDWAVDDEVRRNTAAFGARLREAGAIVDEVDLHLPRHRVMTAAAIHFHHGLAAQIARELDGDVPLSPYVAEFVRWARDTSVGADVIDGLELEATIHAAVGSLFESYDALVCPTAGTVGMIAGDDYTSRKVRVGDTDVDSPFESCLTLPFNILGACPVLAVPSGVASNGVPTGVQIVGRPFDDATVFRIGAAVEQSRPDWPFAVR